MELVDFNGEDYSTLITWFSLAFAKKKNFKEKDLELMEKIKVMSRQWLEDQKEKDSQKE